MSPLSVTGKNDPNDSEQLLYDTVCAVCVTVNNVVKLLLQLMY